MTAPAVTIDQFKQLARDVGPAVSAVLAARVFAECERKRVDAYISPIFEAYRDKFVIDPRWAHEHVNLKGPKDLYLCVDDVMVHDFYDDCDKAHRAHGFKGPQGHCPALTAEHLVIVAERALLELTTPTFGIDADLYGDNRAKFLELIIGAAVKAGNVRNLFREGAA